MRYIRLSLMMPAKGREDEVKKLNEELSAFYTAQDGCLESFVITAAGDSAELGRISVWESEEAAERAANHQHSMSLRSQLHLAVKRGHADRSFIAQ